MRPLQSHSGGGAGIPALRPSRTRLITGVAALAALGGAVAYAATTGRASGRARGRASGARGGRRARGAARPALPRAHPVGVVLGAASYLCRASRARSASTGAAAVVGVLLLLGAELATWSIEHDRRIRAERAVVVRRALTLACVAAGALVVDLALLGTASLPGGGGVLVAAAGVAAAVAAIGFVVRLTRAG